MPSKKKKYNARFPPARIKKIMQMDEEVGKVAATVPVIISRALELFIESLIQQATQTTLAKNAKTLSASHLKHTIESQERYHFLRDLVASVPDHQVEEDAASSNCNNGDESSCSTNPGKRPRGRPRKLKEGSIVVQKKERRKRKRDSSSSESENSEDTDEAEEGTDDESAPTATSNGSVTTSLGTETTSTPVATTTLTCPPPIPELLEQSQEQQQQQQVPEGPVPMVSLSSASTFQAPTMMPTAMPMYQSMPGAASPQLFTWSGPGTSPTGIVAAGFPSVAAAQGPGIPGLQPQTTGFPSMMIPGVGIPTVPATMLGFQGLPGSGFPGISPVVQGFPAMNVAGSGFPGLSPKAPAVAGTASGTQGDDDYDT